MATTYHFYLRKDKVRANGESPIYLRITQNRKSRYVSTGVAVNLQDWNKEKEVIRKSHRNSKSLNSILKRELSKARTVQDELGVFGKDSAKAIQKRLKENNSGDFFELAESYATELEETKKLYTLKTLRVVLGKLENFEGDRTLPIKSIDVEYLIKFERFLKSRYNNRSTTINKNFECIREITRRALKDHLMSFRPLSWI